MEKTTIYHLGPMKISVNDGGETTLIQVGKKVHEVFSSDLLEFCKAYIGKPEVPQTPPEEPRRAKALQDFDNRQAVSTTPIKQITKDEWDKMSRPPTPIPGVSFGGLSDMSTTVNQPSFKKG
jgi:hypothetical protein